MADESAVPDHAPSSTHTTDVDAEMSSLEMKFAELSLEESNDRHHRTPSRTNKRNEMPAKEESRAWHRNPRGRTDGKSHRPALQIYPPPGGCTHDMGRISAQPHGDPAIPMPLCSTSAGRLFPTGEPLCGADRAQRPQKRPQMASTVEGGGNFSGEPGCSIRTRDVPKTRSDKIQPRSLSRGDTAERQHQRQSWQASHTPAKNTTQPNESSVDAEHSSRHPDEDVSCVARHVITHKAINDPDSLDSEELMELVGAICTAAARRMDSAQAAANFCLIVTAKEREPRFIDCLVGWCEEWYNRRDDLLPRRIWYEDEAEKAERVAAASYRWTAFVAFLAELLVALTGGGRSSAGPRLPVSTSHMPARLVSNLLCNCCHVMARWPAKDIEDEMECFVLVLARAGYAIKRMTPHRLRQLLGVLHEAHDLFPDAVRPVFRELRHLRVCY